MTGKHSLGDIAPAALAQKAQVEVLQAAVGGVEGAQLHVKKGCRCDPCCASTLM